MVDYKGKKILVTGGTGFVGSRLAERLVLEEGAHVRVLVRNWSNAVWVSRVNVELIPGDIMNADSVTEAMSGCDLVFHCATGSGSGDKYKRTHIKGSENVLNAALKNGIRVVYMSSIAVHDPVFPDNGNESLPYCKLSGYYPVSKIEVEKMCVKYWQEHGQPVTIIRPTYVWGPKSRNFTMRQLREMSNGNFSLINKGGGACNAVYIDNLVDALLLAGYKDEAIGEVFIITDDNRVTWGNFYNNYAEFLGIEKLPSIESDSVLVNIGVRLKDRFLVMLELLKPNPAPLWRRVIRRLLYIITQWLNQYGLPNYWDLKKYSHRGWLDIAKAKTLLGYRPRYSLEMGMRETERWVNDQMGTELGLPDREHQFDMP